MTDIKTIDGRPAAEVATELQECILANEATLDQRKAEAEAELIACDKKLDELESQRHDITTRLYSIGMEETMRAKRTANQ